MPEPTTAVEADRIVRGFLLKIQGGELDAFIELLLSALHDRKRAKRGTLGYGTRPARIVRLPR